MFEVWVILARTIENPLFTTLTELGTSNAIEACMDSTYGAISQSF